MKKKQQDKHYLVLLILLESPVAKSLVIRTSYTLPRSHVIHATCEFPGTSCILSRNIVRRGKVGEEGGIERILMSFIDTRGP